MSGDDIFEGFDALLWLRSKEGQYAGYPAGTQDHVRHEYFKAAADELERLRVQDKALEQLRSKAPRLNWPEAVLRDPVPGDDIIDLARPRAKPGEPAPPPNAERYTDDVEYFRQICERTKLSTRQIAKAIGINDGELRGYLSGRRAWPYAVQFAIERLKHAEDAG